MGPRVREDDDDASPHSRDTGCPSFSKSFAPSSNRGRREDRVRAAPAVSCALMHKEMRTRAYRFSGNTSAFPAQWLYDLYVLSLVNRSLLPPSPADHSADLTPAIRASGPHAFAVRIRAARLATQTRPPQPAPTSVTWPTSPLAGQDGRITPVICLQGQIIFCESEEKRQAGSWSCPSCQFVASHSEVTLESDMR